MPLAPTTNFQLHQYEATDDMDFAEVNDDYATIDRLAAPTVCTSATRPNTELFVGREIWETDTTRFLKWDGAAWRVISIEDDWVDFVPTLTGITLTAGYDCRYMKRGRTVDVELNGIVATAPAGALTIVPPLTPTKNYPATLITIGHGNIRDNSLGRYVRFDALTILGAIGPITTVSFFSAAAAGNTDLAQVTNAVPVPLASPDNISFKFRYLLP